MIESLNISDVMRAGGEIGSKKLPRQIEAEGKGFQNILDDTISQEHHTKSVQKEKHLDKKLMDVCVETESIFVARMLKEMRKTVHKGEFLNGGFAEEIFEDMLYDEYALSLSKTANLGLAKTLYNELSRK